MGGMALFSVGLSERYPALRRAETSLSVRPMKIDSKEMRTIWVESDGAGIGTIDQTLLPHRFATVRLTTLDDAVRAIKTMQVRGAPLILSLIHISEPTRLGMISYAVFCL